jgi:hypothetical protein
MAHSILDGKIEALTFLWHTWIKSHHIANDPEHSIADRRKAGMICEELQRERQNLIDQIDEVIEGYLETS